MAKKCDKKVTVNPVVVREDKSQGMPDRYQQVYDLLQNHRYSKDHDNAYSKLGHLHDDRYAALSEFKTLDKKFNSIGQVNANVEIVNAREGIDGTLHPTVSERLESDIGTVSSQLADTAKQKNWVNVLDFGAKCDGVTDDTEALKEAIQSSANGLVAGSLLWKKVVYIPSNMFIGSPEKIIIPYSNVCLMGNSRSNSAVIFGHKNGGFHFINPDSTSYIYETEIRDLIIKGNGVCDTLLKMTRFANLYIENVSFQSWSTDGYAVEIEDGSLIFLKGLTIDGGNPANAGNSNALNGIKFTNASFMELSGFNTWNLNRAFVLTTPPQNFIYRDSWTEYVKTIVYVAPQTNNFTNAKITLSNLTLTNGKRIDGFNAVEYGSNATTNLFGNYVLLDNVQLYLHPDTQLKDDTFINIQNMASGSNIFIDIQKTNINGWGFGSVAKVLLLNSAMTALSNFVRVVNCDIRANGVYITSENASNVANTIYHAAFNSNGTVPTYAGGLKLGVTSGNEGRLYYSGGRFYGVYATGISLIPRQHPTAFPQSTATSVEQLKTDVNNLITALKSTGIII